MHPGGHRIFPGKLSQVWHGVGTPHRDAAEEENAELRDMRRRFWFAVALTIPVVVIAMGTSSRGTRSNVWRQSHFWGWVELGLATPVVLWGAGRFSCGGCSRSSTAA